MSWKKLLYSLGVISISLTVLTACGGTDDTSAGDEANDVTEINEEANGDITSDTDNELGEGEELYEEFINYPGVEHVEVSTNDVVANVRIEVEINDDQPLTPEELASAISEMVKENYPDHSIDIGIEQEGLVLTQLHFE